MSRELAGARRHRELALAGVHPLDPDRVAVTLRQGDQAELAQHATGVHLVEPFAYERGSATARAVADPTLERAHAPAKQDGGQIGHEDGFGPSALNPSHGSPTKVGNLRKNGHDPGPKLC